MIKMWGGPRLHDFVSKNLDGVIYEGVAKIYENEKRVHGIITKLPFIIAEDETVIKRNVKWDSSNDLLFGFLWAEVIQSSMCLIMYDKGG